MPGTGAACGQAVRSALRFQHDGAAPLVQNELILLLPAVVQQQELSGQGGGEGGLPAVGDDPEGFSVQAAEEADGLGRGGLKLNGAGAQGRLAAMGYLAGGI